MEKKLNLKARLIKTSYILYSSIMLASVYIRLGYVVKQYFNKNYLFLNIATVVFIAIVGALIEVKTSWLIKTIEGLKKNLSIFRIDLWFIPTGLILSFILFGVFFKADTLIVSGVWENQSLIDRFFRGTGLFCLIWFCLIIFLNVFVIFYKKIQVYFKDARNYLHPLIIWSVVLIISVTYILLSHRIYVYDNVIFWRKAILLNKAFADSIKSGIEYIYATMGADYNCIPSIMVASFIALFGQSRVVFIVAISFYLFFVYIVLYNIISRLTNKPTLIFYLVAIQLPLLMILLRNGMLDMGNCIFSFLAVDILIALLRGKKKSVAIFFVLGILVAFSYLFRRYMLVFTIVFSVILLAYMIYSMIQDIKVKRQAKWFISCGLGYLSGMFIVLLVPFQYRIISQITTNYSMQYQYYNNGIVTGIHNIIVNFSAVILILTLVGIIMTFFMKKYQGLIALSIVGLLLSIVLFLTQQTPNSHHMMTFMPFFIGLLVVANIVLFQKHFVLKLLVVVVTCINFIWCFLPYENPAFLSPKMEVECMDTDYIKNIGTITDQLIELTHKDNWVYIIGGSELINPEIFRNYYLSIKGKYFEPAAGSTSIVDGRDPIPYSLFNVSYILVTDPIQYGKGANYQRVIEIPGNMMLSGTGIAPAFQLVGEYEVTDNIIAFLFERTRELTQEEKNSLTDAIYEYYPDY